LTVRDLIEILEELPYDLPVVVNSCEADEVLIRDELYLTQDFGYKEGEIVKIM
jgi:hypothetical protein